MSAFQTNTARCLAFLTVCLISSLFCFSQSIKGHVFDKTNGQPLAGATVHLQNTKLTTIVNLDGSYVFRNLAPGPYKVEVTAIGYESLPAAAIIISEGGTAKGTDFLMMVITKELSEVTITGGSRETDRTARANEKNADIVQNILSARTIQLLPDVTVANALQRISGVSIQRSSSGEGRYAIIRGMDERYNNTLVNGVKIPSPDPKYRYVPMDLFPSDMLERLEVIKSLTSSMEGDAVGGTMNLVMKNAPDNFSLTAHAGTGFSTLFSSARPFNAFGHGAVNAKSPAGIFGNNYTATQNDFSRSNLNFTGKNLPFNTVAGLTMGGRLFNKHLGIIVSGSYQNMFRGSNSDFLVPNAQPQVVNGLDNQSVISDLYTRKYSTQTTRWGLHNKIDYAFNAKNRITLYNMYVHMDEFQTRLTADSVYLNKITDLLSRSRLQRQTIYNSTLQGEHLLAETFRLSWTGSYALAKSNVPDMAEYDRQSKGDGSYIVQKMSREWQHNTDQDLAAYLNMAYAPHIGNTHTELSFGGMYRHKSRDNYFNHYTLDPVLVNGQPQVYSSFNAANYSFNPAANGQGAITTANPNTYSSHENVSAAYLQLKLMLGNKLQVLGGTRIEHTVQGFTTVMPESFAGRSGTVSYTDMLPDIHLKYALNDKQNIRLSYFKSIVRPDFYEIIPTQTVGELFDIKGNDSLKHSQADNFDLRYEFFPGGADQLLVGAFYKSIKNPIEYAIVRNGGPSAQFFMPENFGTAHNYGVEAVITKFFGMFGVSANYTYTKSRITTSKLYFFQNATAGFTSKLIDQTRPLQGQADHIGNLSFLYKNPKIGLDLQVAYVYTGKRIAQVSPYYNLDYWMLGYGTLDVSFEQRLSKHFGLYGKVNNLTNAAAKTVILQAPQPGSKLPDQIYGNQTVVGKDIYQINLLTGFRYKF
jgi:outer membrane receptor protein involved in Fe transport